MKKNPPNLGGLNLSPSFPRSANESRFCPALPFRQRKGRAFHAFHLRTDLSPSAKTDFPPTPVCPSGSGALLLPPSPFPPHPCRKTLPTHPGRNLHLPLPQIPEMEIPRRLPRLTRKIGRDASSIRGIQGKPPSGNFSGKRRRRGEPVGFPSPLEPRRPVDAGKTADEPLALFFQRRRFPPFPNRIGFVGKATRRAVALPQTSSPRPSGVLIGPPASTSSLPAG